MTPEIVSSPAPLEPGAPAGLDRAAARSAFAAASGPYTLRPRNSERAPGDPTALAAALLQERHVTLELQRAILPLHEAPFDLPGLRAVVRYLPASADSRVGGDWYITAEMPAGDVLLAIGDVAGHGLDAAAGVARLGGARARRAVSRAPPRGNPAGTLLGAGRSGYAAMTMTLQPGDVLLLYSDGLVERRNRPLDEGLATLARAAAGIGDPEHLITAVLDALGSTDSED